MDIDATCSPHECPESDVGSSTHRNIGEINVEMLAADPLLQTDRKWAIRFNAGGTVTIVLGMRDYGRGWYSAHFASLAATRLGLPFHRMRVYYSATLPAVLQTPRESGILPVGSRPGPLAAAIGELIEEMCGWIVENGRAIFAKVTGAAPAAVGFDQTAGRFFVLDGSHSACILDIAELARKTVRLGEASVSVPRHFNTNRDRSRNAEPNRRWLGPITSREVHGAAGRHGGSSGN